MATASGIQFVPELVCTITTLTMTRVTGPGVGAEDLIMSNERSGARPKLRSKRGDAIRPNAQAPRDIRGVILVG